MSEHPIESSILIDPKIVPEMKHRWECFEVMLEALRECEEHLTGGRHTDSWKEQSLAAIDVITQAITKAETRERE